MLLPDSFPAPCPETKGRKPPEELNFTSTPILSSVSGAFRPVKHSGVIFVMGILVRETGSGEKARSWHFYMHHILIGVKGCNSWRAASYFLHHWPVKIMFLLRYKEGKGQSLGTAPCQVTSRKCGVPAAATLSWGQQGVPSSLFWRWHGAGGDWRTSTSHTKRRKGNLRQKSPRNHFHR